jgi:hypothetical protein
VSSIRGVLGGDGGAGFFTDQTETQKQAWAIVTL